MCLELQTRESEHAAFRAAEDKQFQEHLDHTALIPLSPEESARGEAEVDPSRILTSRFAYRDKNYSRRKLDASVARRHKSRLVVSGHQDPDGAVLQTDAPTINRLSVLSRLQLVASRRKSHGWEAAAGDIQAFLNGDALTRELFLHQPRTGLKNLAPQQLLKINKGIFGLLDSHRRWWRRLRQDALALALVLDGVEHRFVQNALDPCVFQLVGPSSSPEAHPEPVTYSGVHVDDLLVVGSRQVGQQVRDALSAAFPVDGWEIDNFEYIGSHVTVSDEGVHVSQEAYATSRLFEVDLVKGQQDLDLASTEQKIDNQSLIGALSWLGSQTRPDLQRSVSLAQQLQKAPTVGDIKFTNQVARRAWSHRDKGIWLRPLDLSSLEFVVYHDSALANALLEGEDGFRLSSEDHELGTMTTGPFADKTRKARRENSKVARQFGILIYLTDSARYLEGGGVGSILDWKSTANPRVCRSTFGAETMACAEAVEMGQYVRSFVETVLKGSLQRVEFLAGSQLTCVTDCTSLVDHLHREGIPRVPSDKRLEIDLAALRQHFELERLDRREASTLLGSYRVPVSRYFD